MDSIAHALVVIPTNSPQNHSKIELSTHREMRTSLGDQRSQVRVLSPRFAADCSAVKPFPADCSRFQLVGISHSAGTSTYSRIACLSYRTTLFRANALRWQPHGRNRGAVSAMGSR
jgi:hypothetical protein